MGFAFSLSAFETASSPIAKGRGCISASGGRVNFAFPQCAGDAPSSVSQVVAAVVLHNPERIDITGCG